MTTYEERKAQEAAALRARFEAVAACGFELKEGRNSNEDIIKYITYKGIDISIRWYEYEDKFSFNAMKPTYAYYHALKERTKDLKVPNNVKVPSKKKIESWLEYEHALEMIRREMAQEWEAKKADFLEKIMPFKPRKTGKGYEIKSEFFTYYAEISEHTQCISTELKFYAPYETDKLAFMAEQLKFDAIRKGE